MLLAACGAGAFAWWSMIKSDAPPTSVKTVKIDVGRVQSSIRSTGSVEGLRSVHVATTAGGRIDAVLTEVGASVGKGQVLVRMETAERAAQLKADGLEAQSIKVEIAQLERELKALKLDVSLGVEPRQKLARSEDGLDLARIRLRKAEAKVQISQLRLGEAVVVSPIKGTITELNARSGEVVASGVPLLTVVDGSSLAILARLEQSDAQLVRPGMLARIMVDGAPGGGVDEKVLRIEPAVRKDGRADFLAAWIGVTPSAHPVPLRANQQVDVRLLSESGGNVARLPLEALITAQGRSSAWVVENDRLRSVPVRVGVVGDKHAEVLSGLRSGQTVVVPEGKPLKEGERVAARPLGS